MAQMSVELLTDNWHSVLLLALSVLVACILIYYISAALTYYGTVRNIGSVLKDLPGPSNTHWLYGDLKLIPGFNEEMLDFLRDNVKKFPYLSTFWFGALRPTILVTHPDTVKVILRSTEPKQMMGGGAYSLIEPWLGDGLLLSKGEKWFRNRRLLTPAFHFDVLKPYVDIYNQSADSLLAKFATGEVGPSSSVEITQHVTLCTLNIIMRCAMSYKEDVQGQGKNNHYANSVLNISKLLSSRALKPYLYNNALYYLTGEGREFRRELKHLHDVSERVITERRRELALSEEFRTKRHPDFLDILLLARDDDGEGLTDREIRDEVDTFLFEGHDTTSSAISWILYTLAGHPDHQAQCRKELQDVVGDRNSQYIEWNDVQSTRMSHLTKCIKEAMRIHSPVHWIGREVQQSLDIHGVTLKPHTLVDISIYSLHHNPVVWGEDHNLFKPERFDTDAMDNMDSYAFVPFSAGPRNCIGQNFAMNELKVVVGRVLLKYELKVDESHLVRHLPEVVMRAETGIKLFCDPI